MISGSQGQIFKEQSIPIILKLFHKIENERTLLNSFYEASINLIAKAEKDITKKLKKIWQTKHLSTIKTLNKVSIMRICLNIIKAIYDTPTANIIFNRKILKAFPLRSGIRQGCLFLPHLFNIVLEIFLTQELNQGLLHCRQILYQQSYEWSPKFCY